MLFTPSLWRPASLEEFANSSLGSLRWMHLRIEDGNRYLAMSDGFLLDSQAGRRYFGNEELVIPADIEGILYECVADISRVFNVSFAQRSIMSHFGYSAFEHCEPLQSICIPRSADPSGVFCGMCESFDGYH
jgi:hypothetical protein